MMRVGRVGARQGLLGRNDQMWPFLGGWGCTLAAGRLRNSRPSQQTHRRPRITDLAYIMVFVSTWMGNPRVFALPRPLVAAAPGL
jgi:hypothetical protein